MIKTTIHQAKTHLSRLLRLVEQGETVLILRGEVPVARLVAVDAESAPGRPAVGEPTTTGVNLSEDTFRPLTDGELKEWGL